MEKKLLLSVRNLCKSFGSRKVLDNISFDIHEGKITGFLGPNGAGKTTTIKCLLGLIKRDVGQILVRGNEIQDAQNLKFKITVGALMEFPSFYSNLTAEENLRLLSLIDNHQIDNTRVVKLLDLVGLKNDIKRQIKTFSFGMKQNLAIADAILGDPELMILDEPFNGLDPNAMENLNKILKNYKKNKGTVFISSHILSEVEDLCERIILINKGKIIYRGELKDLTSKTGLKEIYLKLTKNENT